MSSYLQLSCTIISLILNALLIYLIIFKSSRQIGKYKYLMIYTAIFEIIWGVFDLPAEIGSYSHGYTFIVYRVNHPWTWLSDTQSTLLVVIYTGIFGASMAIFAAHFIYRYGYINRKFGDRVILGWRFCLLFVVPIVFGVWWAGTLAIFFWRTQETDDYSREAMWEHFHIRIEDMSYTSALFYQPGVTNGSIEIRWKTWIGVGNFSTMVIISVFCVFFFGYRCYRELSKEICELASMSRIAANFQRQLFYSLVVQTTIPLVLLHIPIFGYFLCPMLNLDYDLASDFLLTSNMIYPAIDPLPSFVIIKNYRNAVKGELGASHFSLAMSSYLQLSCTIISLILNVLLIYLIILKSPKQTGKYKHLMIYTAVFEIIWGVFDLPAEIGSYSHGYAAMLFRVNHPWTWLTDTQSTLIVVVYTGLFGASLAIFGVHFIYRYGVINRSFGEKVISGWKYYALFAIPVSFAFWWSVALTVCCWPTEKTDEYSREAIWEHFHLRIEDISYASALYYQPGVENGTLDFRWKTWIGVGNMSTMVIISVFCVFFFGYQCYRELSKEICELASMSRIAANFQRQLFYSLVVQTTIPLILMHIPIGGYFLCPMLNMDYDLACDFLITTIALYPAIDPLPSFFIIKNYRNAVKGAVKNCMFWRKKKKPRAASQAYVMGEQENR